jgi:hypothetical protein
MQLDTKDKIQLLDMAQRMAHKYPDNPEAQRQDIAKHLEQLLALLADFERLAESKGLG